MKPHDLWSRKFEHIIKMQIADYEATVCRSRPMAERLQSRHLLQHAVVILDLHRETSIDHNGNTALSSVTDAFEKLTSTQDGSGKIREKLKLFRA
jgi:predicted deacylase